MPHTNMDLAEEMLYRVQEVKVVEARVEAENRRRRRARWVMLAAAHVPLFPRSTI